VGRESPRGKKRASAVFSDGELSEILMSKARLALEEWSRCLSRNFQRDLGEGGSEH
jgi:hypothetical protein